jgi:holo-[acyl-carrier protein] synthase
MIVGIGVDIVDVPRFERATSRTPGVLTRLFSEAEQHNGDTRRTLRSMAARFAAKEALIKALGDSTGLRWHDMAVVSDDLGNPSFEIHNAVEGIVVARGISRLHLSMSHDAGLAIAYVVAEGDG